MRLVKPGAATCLAVALAALVWRDLRRTDEWLPPRDGQPSGNWQGPPRFSPELRAAAARHGVDLDVDSWPGAMRGDVDNDLAIRRCRECGCTEDDACWTLSGPCRWVGVDLCSVCGGGQS